jgi:hypothetical protein
MKWYIREVKRMIAFIASKMKGCVHINEAKEDQNGKLQRDPKSKPKPKLKETKKKEKGEFERPCLLGKKIT